MGYDDYYVRVNIREPGDLPNTQSDCCKIKPMQRHRLEIHCCCQSSHWQCRSLSPSRSSLPYILVQKRRARHSRINHHGHDGDCRLYEWVDSIWHRKEHEWCSRMGKLEVDILDRRYIKYTYLFFSFLSLFLLTILKESLPSEWPLS
jgi:hypothetical protein